VLVAAGADVGRAGVELRHRARRWPLPRQRQQQSRQHHRLKLQQGVALCKSHEQKSSVVVPCEDCVVELSRSGMEGQVGRLLDGRAAALLAVMCVARGRVSSGFSAASVRPTARAAYHCGGGGAV